MDRLIDNFKRITLFRIIALVGAVVVIIGIFPTFASLGNPLATYGTDLSLIKGFPIGGIIEILAALTIIAGVAFANKIVSIVGAGSALVGNIVIALIMRSVWFYEKIQIKIAEDVLGFTPDTEAPSGEELFGLEGEALDTYNQATEEFSQEMDEGIREAFTCKIGFYLILIGALIALAALVIDLVKSDKELEEKILDKAESISEVASGAASAVMSNTTNEYSGSGENVPQKVHFEKNKKNPWTCSKCGEENDGQSQFCVYCGEPKPLPRRCYYCGTILENHMMFCPKCGTKYDEEKANEITAEESSVPEKTICKYCGAELPEGATFCGKCGRQQ